LSIGKLKNTEEEMASLLLSASFFGKIRRKT